MIVISKVIESVIDEGLRVVKLLKFGETDNINTFQVGSFGDETNVPEGYDALYIKTSNSSEPVCVGFINKVVFDDLKPGEKQIFSTNEGGDTIKAFVKLLNDGIIHFNGDVDFIAGFNNLKSGFDTAIQDLNKTNAELNKIINALNTWVPIPNDGGAALKALATGIVSVIDSTASIDSSKKDNLKTE